MASKVAGTGLTPDQLAAVMRRLSSTPEVRKRLRKAHRPVANVGLRHVRAAMRGGDRQLSAVAGKVRASPSATAARLAVPSGRPAAAVFGTLGPTGWLGNERHAGTAARNNPVWVGNGWTVATAGEGPRGVNDGLDEGTPEIVAEYAKQMVALLDEEIRRR